MPFKIFSKNIESFTIGAFLTVICLIVLVLTPSITAATADGDIAAFRNNQVVLYNTKMHPKAKGIHLKLPYPRSWIAEEGRHPNVVKKFKTHDGNHMISTLILIKNSPIKKNFSSAQINSENFRKSIAEGLGTYFESGATQVDGENAIWIFYVQNFSLPTANIRAYFLTYIVNFHGKMVLLMHGVGGAAEDLILKEKFYSYMPLFQTITSNVIFPDKWIN
ncbi:MAG: hypothetical protein R6U40_01770 [Desulfobacterales bacterium]